MSRTISLIETFVAENNQVALANLRTEVTTRPSVTWTPEMFDRKVAQLKVSAAVGRPSAAQLAASGLKGSKIAPAPKSAPKWTVSYTPFEGPSFPVTVSGPVVTGVHQLTFDRNKLSIRADGERFESAVGTLGTHAVKVSAASLQRLATKGTITVFVAERAHKVSIR